MHAAKKNKSALGLLGIVTVACASLVLSSGAQAAAPGILGTGAPGTASFDLTAAPGFVSQPDGNTVYTWGYGCASAPVPARFVPEAIAGPTVQCPTMQLPGPTLIVHQGDTVTVRLTNNLPPAAGTTSILFPGFTVQSSGGVAGLLTQEATNSATVSYTFKADTPGTHTYYSGTRGDLQIEMGLYGALIVLPSATPAACDATPKDAARSSHGTQADYRLAHAAYNHPGACYDREYLFQFSEIDPGIHRQAEEQAQLPCNTTSGCMAVATEPYVPAYFMINGRSMPDDMDPNYAFQYPHQPYNGNPHMHPGELVLLRIIGNGRWQHPFHQHGNHTRVLARDGNLLLTATGNQLAGPLLFTTTTTPGQTMDGIFQWTGKGLNWDVFGHGYAGDASTCSPDSNGFHNVPADPNFYEWCGDHGKPLEAHPFGQVGGGGPITLPDPNILALGPWYGGSPYLGPEATQRAVGATPIPPSGTVANSPTEEAGFSFMWHSHNEREITTNNAFPGGMMMMMLVDPWTYNIVEAN